MLKESSKLQLKVSSALIQLDHLIWPRASLAPFLIHSVPFSPTFAQCTIFIDK